jgi:hypothetical protein
MRNHLGQDWEPGKALAELALAYALDANGDPRYRFGRWKRTHDGYWNTAVSPWDTGFTHSYGDGDLGGVLIVDDGWGGSYRLSTETSPQKRAWMLVRLRDRSNP